MELDTAMEFSIWKEEPLSPVYSVLEDQTDVWDLFKEDVAKQAQTPERDPLGGLENPADWLPDSPDDSCDSLADNSPQALIARAQLASQLLQDLDEVLIKEEYSSSDWYEPKTGLSMFDELPSPTPSFFKDEALAGAATRPFAGLSLTTAHFAPAAAFSVSAFATPAPPAAVPVALTAVQQQQQQQAPAESLQALQHSTAASLPLTDTQTLLQEFECVFGKVEQSHGGALTPPQSPPHHSQHLYIATAPATATTFVYQQQPQQQQQQLQQQQLLLQPLQPQQAAYDTGLLTTVHHQDQQQQQQQQQQQLIAEVDEIVRSRVHAEESWPASPSAFAASFAPPSPCTSSSSSCSFSSDSPAPASPETDDPDWLPAASPSSSSGAASPGSAASGQDAASAASAAPGPSRKRGQSKRSKPYSHNVEDKRSRKKEQNKNAATRYRMKKKAEVEVILGEENELKDKNDELAAKVADLSQEVRYLKNLMRDLFRARGLIK